MRVAGRKPCPGVMRIVVNFWFWFCHFLSVLLANSPRGIAGYTPCFFHHGSLRNCSWNVGIFVPKKQMDDSFKSLLHLPGWEAWYFWWVAYASPGCLADEFLVEELLEFEFTGHYKEKILSYYLFHSMMMQYIKLSLAELLNEFHYPFWKLCVVLH